VIEPNALKLWAEGGSATAAGFDVSLSSPPRHHSDAHGGIEAVLTDNELVAVASLSSCGILKLEACYPSSANWIVLESHQPSKLSEFHDLLERFLANIRRA
jgi:hypothetical protein